MNLLDENIVASQRELLRGWGVPVRQIGYDLGESGMQDDQIIPFLHEQRRVTFFTRDLGFYDRTLCHSRYTVVCLAVSKDEAAVFVRKFLRHPDFSTQAKRLGSVVRVSHGGVRAWRLKRRAEKLFKWSE